MSKRVYLRALEPDDYKVSIKWRKDDEIWDMLGGTKYFVSEAYEKNWVEKAIFASNDLKLAVCLIENNQYIGNVYMTDINMINRSCHSHILIGEHDFSAFCSNEDKKENCVRKIYNASIEEKDNYLKFTYNVLSLS